MPENQNTGRSTRASSITSKSSRKRKSARKKKAKEWTYYIELLKKPLDCIYEICRQDRNISACKEVLMYLQNAERDFSSLITAINLEDSYDVENKPQCVAWEVRKMTKSPTQALVDVLPISPMMVDQLKLVQADRCLDTDQDELEKRDREMVGDSAGWQVVKSKRRPSMSSTISDVLDTLDSDFSESAVPSRALSVYERLSGSTGAGIGSNTGCRRHSSTGRAGYATVVSTGSSRNKPTSITSGIVSSGTSRYTSPRSVMDLPQTKSSMAKISYCRQRIWEKDVQPSLAEKIRVKKMKESASKVNLAIKHGTGHGTEDMNDDKSRTKPVEVKVTKSGLNRTTSLSLKAIKETAEAEEVEPVNAGAGAAITSSMAATVKRCESTRSLPAHSVWGMDLARDREWREMTEEEESLAMEELSINAEIEEAQSELDSLDIDLTRNDTLTDSSTQTKIVTPVDATSSSTIPAFPLSTSFIDQKVFMAKLEEGYKQFCQESWSDIVEKEFAGHYREPGQLADKHDKLCSPSRKRDRDDPHYPVIQAERLRRAEELREEIQREKAQKLKDLAQRREDLRCRQVALAERKRLHLAERMERATDNKEKELAKIVRKAKDDDQKVMEVRFIQSCTEDNKRMDREARAAVLEERKQTLAEERARRAEEKVAKEHAAEERRVQAELERVLRLQEKQEKRKVRHAEYTLQKTEAELEMRQRRRLLKARKEELKLQGAEDKQVKEVKSLEKKNAIKERHNKTLDIVRQRAQQLSSPRTASAWTGLMDPAFWPADKTTGDDLPLMLKCEACHVLLSNEMEAMSHVVSEDHLNIVNVSLSTADDPSSVLDSQLDSLVRLSMEDSLTSIDSGAGTEADTTDCDQATSDEIPIMDTTSMAAVQESDSAFASLYRDPPMSATPLDRRITSCIGHLASSDFSQRLDTSAKRTMQRHIQNVVKLGDTLASLTDIAAASANIAEKFVESQLVFNTLSDTNVREELLTACKNLCIADHFAASILFAIPLTGSTNTSVRTTGKSTRHMPTYAQKISTALQAPFGVTGYGELSSLVQLLKNCIVCPRSDEQRNWQSCGLSHEIVLERIQLLGRDLHRHGVATAVQRLLSSVDDVPVSVLTDLSTLAELFADCTPTDTSVCVSIARSLVAHSVRLLRQSSCGSDAAAPETRPASPRKTRSSDSVSEVSSSIAVKIYNTLCLLSTISTRSSLWKVLLSDPVTSFRLYLLLAESLRACRSIAPDCTGGIMAGEISRLSVPMRLAACFAAVGPSQQALCAVGWQRSLLSSLAAVPLRYLVNHRLQTQVLPALIAITAQSNYACQLLSLDIGLLVLIRFLKRTSGNAAFSEALKGVIEPTQWLSIEQFYLSHSGPHQD